MTSLSHNVVLVTARCLPFHLCHITNVHILCVHTLVKYVGGYHGLLSGVTVRPGSVEPHSVVECLYACREGLDFGDLETLGSGMKVDTPTDTPSFLIKLPVDEFLRYYHLCNGFNV